MQGVFFAASFNPRPLFVDYTLRVAVVKQNSHSAQLSVGVGVEQFGCAVVAASFLHCPAQGHMDKIAGFLKTVHEHRHLFGGIGSDMELD